MRLYTCLLEKLFILRDEEGYTEEVRFNFDEEGMGSIEDTISLLQDFLDPDDLTFVF